MEFWKGSTKSNYRELLWVLLGELEKRFARSWTTFEAEGAVERWVEKREREREGKFRKESDYIFANV